jgi:hypothetical protein
VSENKVWRGISGTKMEKVTGSLCKQHENAHNVYSSPIIMMMIKSRRMGYAGHIDHVGGRD